MSRTITNELLLDSLKTAVLILNQELVIQYANNAAESMFELSKNQLHNQPLLQFLVNDDLKTERLRHAIEHHESYTEGELQLIFSTGRHSVVDAIISPFDRCDTPALLLELIPIDHQRKLYLDNQHWAHHKAAKELIRGLAHEIKNPLGGIRGAAQLLGKELHDEELKEYTTLIVEQSDRLRNLVDRLLGPNAVPKFRMQNVHRIIEQIRTLISLECGDGVSVERDYDPSIPDMLLDEDMLQQAVLNIARNALQALEGRGNISFVTRIQRQQMIHGTRYPLCVEIKIVDDGPGIAEEIRDTLFYPMISTKSDGSGLGLSIAQSLVEHHQGKIEVESWPGHTVFSILLPINRQESTS